MNDLDAARRALDAAETVLAARPHDVDAQTLHASATRAYQAAALARDDRRCEADGCARRALLSDNGRCRDHQRSTE